MPSIVAFPSQVTLLRIGSFISDETTDLGIYSSFSNLDNGTSKHRQGTSKLVIQNIDKINRQN